MGSDNGKITKKRGNKVVTHLTMTDFSALPRYLKDNEYILTHYRVEWPVKQTILSMFRFHNETLNIWTHLVGFLFFLSLTIYSATKLPRHFANVAGIQEVSSTLPLSTGQSTSGNADLLQNASDCCLLGSIKQNMFSPEHHRPVPRWPFMVFLGAAIYCLFASTSFHLLSCHSKRWHYVLLRLDYTGIAALIAGSYCPPLYYSFMCHPFFLRLYVGGITLLGIAAIIVSWTPVFQNPELRTLRAGLFTGIGISGVIPLAHKAILFWDQPEAFHIMAYDISTGCIYILGAILYATRIPERWRPGMFDIAGHSHQLFHVLVIAAAYTHYQAVLLYLKWRDAKGC